MKWDLVISAGEASGDLHGEALIRALRARSPSLKIAAVAGPRMRNEGVDLILPTEGGEVMGFGAVIKRLPTLLKRLSHLEKRILSENPRGVVTIDYPAFHLKLAERLRKKGYRGLLCHYVCPSVWAWKKNRIHALARDYNLLLCILPFEPPLFTRTPLDVRYVGHPLRERILEEGSPQSDLIALFPGSRPREIERHLPLLLGAAKALKELHPQLQFALSVAHPDFRERLERALDGLPCKLVPAEETYSLMRSATLALAKSGTVILELALFNTPTVAIYSPSHFDTLIARMAGLNLPHYTLPNLIVQKEIIPELIAPRLPLKKLIDAAERLLHDLPGQRRALGEVAAHLGTAKASEGAASAILEKLLV